MEERAKKLGIWGLEKRTIIGVAGNSLIVRVPKSIARFIGLKKGEVVSLHPLGRDKLLVEETARTRKQAAQQSKGFPAGFEAVLVIAPEPFLTSPSQAYGDKVGEPEETCSRLVKEPNQGRE